MSQIKTAISIDQSVFKIIDSLAKKAHISRSRFFEMAAKAWVKKEEDKDLTARINRAIEKIKPTAEETRQAEAMRRHYSKLVEGQW